MFTPKASSTSALPLLLLTLRPPCLLTLAPAAAATNMVQVEMLKVCDPSPPVPTMSTKWRASLTCTLVENSRMTWAAAVISPMVSFFTRKPVIKAAVMTGDNSPLMIMRTTLSISSWKISRCSMVRCSASTGVMGMGFSLGLMFAFNSIKFRVAPVNARRGSRQMPACWPGLGRCPRHPHPNG